MNDKKSKENLIRFVSKHCYYSIKDKHTRYNFAVEKCKDLQEKYTWPALKRASNENYCTSMGKLKMYAIQHKEILSKNS